MKLPRRNFLCLAACAAVLPALSRIARAQAYPSRPVRIIVGFPAGGPAVQGQSEQEAEKTYRQRGAISWPPSKK